jgi:hypothetical protein
MSLQPIETRNNRFERVKIGLQLPFKLRVIHAHGPFSY